LRRVNHSIVCGDVLLNSSLTDLRKGCAIIPSTTVDVHESELLEIQDVATNRSRFDTDFVILLEITIISASVDREIPQ
jgi:hypothetical protein